MSEIAIWLQCPSCGHQWHACTTHPGAWWATPTDAEKCAAQCACPKCDTRPPMQIVTAQADLFRQERTA